MPSKTCWRLRDGWGLVTDGSTFALRNLRYDAPTWWTLERPSFAALALLDGTCTIAKVRGALVDRLDVSPTDARTMLDLLIYRFRPILTAGTAGDVAAPPPVVRVRRAVPRDPEARRHNCAPARLTVTVTYACDRRCVYCYADAGGAGDTCSAAHLEFLAREVHDLAIADVVVTGGEPFLVPHVAEWIQGVASTGTRVAVTTKAVVPATVFQGEAREHILVDQSLDAARPAPVASLTGRASAYPDALASMDGMRRAGVRFRVKSVLTACTVDEILPLAALAKKHGAQALTLTEYRPSLGRNEAALELDDQARDRVRSAASRARGTLPVEVDLACDADGVAFEAPGSRCSEGIRALSVLPDGRWTRCPSLPLEHQVSGGDVWTRGVYGTWNRDREYRRAVGSGDAAWSGTACGACADRRVCDRTGRCILFALQVSGRPYGPDRSCARAMAAESVS